MELAAAVNLPDKDVKVEGKIFLPQKVRRVWAVVVIVVANPRQAAGTFYEDPQLRRHLETTECGLLLATINNIVKPRPSGMNVGKLAEDGADVLRMLLRRLAEESGHPEIADAPLLFWGGSAAGNFGTTFAALHPQRTIGFVLYHSDARQGVNMKVVTQMPALLVAGGKDIGHTELMQDLWKRGRAASAPWTFVVDPDATHLGEEHLKKASNLMILWIAAVLRQRVSPDGGTLRAVTDAFAWMGNNRTGDIASAATFPGSKLEASWLPDEPTARAWRVMIRAAK